MKATIILMTILTLLIGFSSVFLSDVKDLSTATPVTILVAAILAFAITGVALADYDNPVADFFPVFVSAIALFAVAAGFYVGAIGNIIVSHGLNPTARLFIVLFIVTVWIGKHIGLKYAEKNNLPRKEALDYLAAECFVIAAPMSLLILRVV